MVGIAERASRVEDTTEVASRSGCESSLFTGFPLSSVLLSISAIFIILSLASAAVFRTRRFGWFKASSGAICCISAGFRFPVFPWFTPLWLELVKEPLGLVGISLVGFVETTFPELPAVETLTLVSVLDIPNPDLLGIPLLRPKATRT